MLFNGPVDSYVTPRFYTSTKPDTGKVVPTWNYSAVQVYGAATVFFDAGDEHTGAYLQRQICDLTRLSEGGIMNFTGGNHARAWEVGDAPCSYIELLKKSITGIEIEVKRLEGKYKMNQEMGKDDRQGVVEGFEALGTEHGRAMARTVKERGDLKDAKVSAASVSA